MRCFTDNVADEKWHYAMSSFQDIHYEQTVIYGAGQRGEVDSHLLIEENDNFIGGARVGLYVAPAIRRGLALVRFGPFWRRVDNKPDPKNYRQVLSALIEEYCERRKLYLIVRPRAHPDFYPVEARALEEAGIEGRESSHLDRYFVDLSLTEDDLRSSLDQKWRYNLKAGLRNSIDIRAANDPSGIALFQKIYVEMVVRKNLNYPGVDLPKVIPELIRLPDEMRLQVVLAYHKGEAIAGVAYAIVGDVAYYVFGASNEQATQLRAGYVLQWHIINRLRAAGHIRWYELGGPGDPGIQQFKKGLSGKRGVLLHVQEFHYCPDLLARTVVGGMFALRDIRNKLQRWQRKRSPSKRRSKIERKENA